MSTKILLVDDVKMFLELQAGFLKRSSVHILTAENGEAALKICREERPSLIFMDLHMPVMSGDQCCRAIKADPALKAIPVIMITSEGKEGDKTLCLSAGCNDFLTKPLDRNQFLEKARHHLPEIDRREKRVGCLIKVKFRAFGVNLSGQILDISLNGVYIEADYDITAGTRIDIVFALPVENGGIIQAKGKVAWVNSRKSPLKTPYPPGFGVEFVGITEESRAELESFLHQRNGFNIIL